MLMDNSYSPLGFIFSDRSQNPAQWQFIIFISLVEIDFTRLRRVGHTGTLHQRERIVS